MTAAQIGGKLRLLNLVTSLVVVSFLALIFSMHFFPDTESLLGFSNEYSMIWVLLFTGILAVGVIVFSAILKKQIVSKITEYGNNLNGLLEVTRDIREEIYGDILLEKILDCALAITQSEMGAILLRREDSLVFKTVKGAKADELLNTEVSVERGIASWVARHGQSVCANDVRTDERFDPALDERTGFHSTSMLCVPLNNTGRTVGVIQLVNKAGAGFSGNDMDMVSYLADQAAISLERAQFYEDERNFEIHVTNTLFEAIDRLTPQNDGHSKRVARYCNLLARAIAMPDGQARRLHIAALLHDIGFIRIPLDRKSDPAFYTKHPTLGHEILTPITFYTDLAPMILHHHERFDGTGYPSGIAGEQIPLESRILAIAEVFDAITNPTSYAAPRSLGEAIEELRAHAGTQFDPELVNTFAEEAEKEDHLLG